MIEQQVAPARAKRSAPAASASRTQCPRCQRAVKLSAATVLCGTCRAQVTRKAQDEQELAYLQAYLSTRANDTSRQVRRLRALAESLGLDWRTAPPIQYFSERLTAPWRGHVGSPPE